MSDVPNAPDWVQAVLPSEIARQRNLGWPDFHPEDFCHVCGRRNPVWYTEDWYEVMPSEAGILCPSCFAAVYEEATGRPGLWRLSYDDPAKMSDPLRTVTT